MIKLTLKAIALMSLTAIGATEAQAHAQLDHASPAVGSTVGSSPGQVTLYFTQKLEPKFSGADVKNSSGARVDAGSSASGSSLHVGLKKLPAGTYTVHWHVLSVDTHKTQGSFSFHVSR